jgi:hypothetical protein
LYGIAKREGLLAEDFPAKLFVQPRFRSVVLIEGHPELTALKARAVPCRNLSSRPFGLQFVACSLPMAPN